MQDPEQHPWSVLNDIVRQKGEGVLGKVAELMASGDHNGVVAPGVHLVKEKLPCDTNPFLTPSWWAAEQSQGSASIPETKLWVPVVFGRDTFDLLRMR
jgi:hypothetical protein